MGTCPISSTVGAPQITFMLRSHTRYRFYIRHPRCSLEVCQAQQSKVPPAGRASKVPAKPSPGPRPRRGHPSPNGRWNEGEGTPMMFDRPFASSRYNCASNGILI